MKLRLMNPTKVYEVIIRVLLGGIESSKGLNYHSGYLSIQNHFSVVDYKVPKLTRNVNKIGSKTLFAKATVEVLQSKSSSCFS